MGLGVTWGMDAELPGSELSWRDRGSQGWLSSHSTPIFDFEDTDGQEQENF